jgi:type I restriction-modification system DNA methylase subunit
MTSEELSQRGLTKKGVTIIDFEFFQLGATTLKQLKKTKIIQNRDYGKYEIRKPDGLLVDRGNKSKSKVIAVLEYKKPSEFQTDKKKKEAIEQCNDLCQELEAQIGIITDGIVTYWINPNDEDKNNEYKDRTTGKKRSFSYILNDDKQRLQKKFFIKESDKKDISKLDDETRETYRLVKRILEETNSKNSVLKATEKTDPTPLARSVWQSIYISTKDNPTACLYNVVEIFIFKFLSDLGVLKGVKGFDYLLKLYKTEDNKTVLEHYARTCREEIRNLFEAGDDGTTIINGTIFVNKDGSPVLSQATLFKDTIEKYAKFGDLKNIEKGFKTKLFETFLKQSKDKSKLGQFFTPRKVVKGIVEMADVDKAEFICDPFCGVGGFLLEPFQISQNLKNKFSPKNNKINPPVKLLGYDTGREDNDEQKRTIILAKANMLIYLSDLVEKNPTLNEEFSKIINDTFHFLSDSNLGTLKETERFEKNENKPDLIITNPPYITSGVTTIRKEIEEDGLTDYYKNSGKGMEGLCLKWIIKNLKRKGQAFIVLPDNIFNVFANKFLRDEIKKNCYINCIISLPAKTFFNTPKKTYILGITKKDCDEDECENLKQDFPVFTYLVSNIGETLDVNRFEIPENDLDNAKNLFNQFKGSPNSFQTDDPRCKLQPIEKFENEKYWIIDKWWSKEEKIKLGVEEEDESLTLDEFKDQIEKTKAKLGELEWETDKTKEKKYKTKIVYVTDTTKDGEITQEGIFEAEKGNAKYTKKYMHDHQGEFPVYSSQTSNLGEIGSIDTFDYDEECFTWTTDGTYVGTVFYRNGKFSITTHCGILRVKPEYKNKVDFEYLNFILNQTLPNYKLGEGSNKRLGTERMKEVQIEIPIDENGEFDLDKQREIADKHKKIEEIKEKLKDNYEKMINSKVQIIEVEE